MTRAHAGYGHRRPRGAATGARRVHAGARQLDTQTRSIALIRSLLELVQRRIAFSKHGLVIRRRLIQLAL